MMQMSYKTDYNAATQVCPQENRATVDDVTLDIFCPSKDRVLNVSLSGPGVGSLCSLYISGGRNLALRQRANQSSRLIPDGETDKANAGSAEYAVDGTVHTDQCSSPQQIILSHTRSENDGNISSWWSLTFSESVNISRFLIYSGNDSNSGLKSFALTASTTGGSDTTFIDRGKVQTVYTVVPSPRICFPVDEVRIEQEIGENKTLSLCEVFVFGEKSCPAGTFGLDCERQCNCANQISCFVHSGGCPSGYSPDYSSMECPVLSAAIEPKKLSESTCANCTRICSAASPATGSRNDATDEQSGNTEDSAVPAIVAVVVVVVVFVLIVALVLLWRRCLKKSARSQGEETGISLKSMQETVK